MQCARAFGALISMRDDPMDAPIPEKIEVVPSSYHTDALRDAKAELVVLEGMTDAEITVACHKQHKQLTAEWEAAEVRRKEGAARYRAMLAKVEAWTPPTKDHEGLKEFMVQQLSESLKFDCSEGWAKPTREEPKDWFAKQRRRVLENIAYHMQHEKEDRARADERTEWVQQLRESLRETVRT